MKRNIYFLVGPSGCGKSTLETNLLKTYPEEFHRLKSSVTRSPREGEVNGVSYDFISLDKFKEMEKNKEFLQTTEFAGNYYATKKSDYLVNKPHSLFAVVPSQAAYLSKLLSKEIPDLNVKIVHFNISKDKIRENMLKRGDSLEDVKNRLSKDNIAEEFKTYKLKADYEVLDDDLNPDLFDKVYDWMKNG